MKRMLCLPWSETSTLGRPTSLNTEYTKFFGCSLGPGSLHGQDKPDPARHWAVSKSMCTCTKSLPRADRAVGRIIFFSNKNSLFALPLFLNEETEFVKIVLESYIIDFDDINLGFPSQFIKSTKVLMATPQGRHLGYHTPKQVSNQEPPDSRPCVLTTTLLGGVQV